MTYRVPPKQIVVYRGRTYGAGDHVPGYTPPSAPKPAVPEKPVTPKSSSKKTKKSRYTSSVFGVEEDTNLLTGDSTDGSELL